MRPKAASTITSQKSRALNLIQGVLGKKIELHGNALMFSTHR